MRTESAASYVPLAVSNQCGREGTMRPARTYMSTAYKWAYYANNTHPQENHRTCIDCTSVRALAKTIIPASHCNVLQACVSLSKAASAPKRQRNRELFRMRKVPRQVWRVLAAVNVPASDCHLPARACKLAQDRAQEIARAYYMSCTTLRGCSYLASVRKSVQACARGDNASFHKRVQETPIFLRAGLSTRSYRVLSFVPFVLRVLVGSRCLREHSSLKSGPDGTKAYYTIHNCACDNKSKLFGDAFASGGAEKGSRAHRDTTRRK